MFRLVFAIARKLHNLSKLSHAKYNKKPTNWLGQAKRRATKIRPEAVGGGFSAVYSSFDKCRPEVAGDVISGVAAD